MLILKHLLTLTQKALVDADLDALVLILKLMLTLAQEALVDADSDALVLLF